MYNPRLVKSLKILSVLLIMAAAYITFSTMQINKEAYMKRAWAHLGPESRLESWKGGEVSVVSLGSSGPAIVPEDSISAEWNRQLLRLNGNRAVRVLFHHDQEALLGPMVVYYNPFTKQVIGYDVMM